MIQWITHDERFERDWSPVAIGRRGGFLSIVLVWLTLESAAVLVFKVFFMRELQQYGRLWWPSLQLSDGERARIYALSLIPRSCHSCERIRMSSIWKWFWTSDACCMMALIGAWKSILNSLPKLHVQTLQLNLSRMVCCWHMHDDRQCRYCRDSQFGLWGGQDGLADRIVVEMPFCWKQH